MAGECLPAHAFPHVPQLSRGVTGPRDEQPAVRSQREAHDISSVAGKCGRLLAGLDVPEGAEGWTHSTCD